MFRDPTILDVSDVELVDLKFLEEDPVVVVQFTCQQLNCARDKCAPGVARRGARCTRARPVTRGVPGGRAPLSGGRCSGLLPGGRQHGMHNCMHASCLRRPLKQANRHAPCPVC